MLLILTYDAIHLSQLIMLLLIFPNLSCYSSYPTYHATHPTQLIMLLISPSLSCYSSYPTYHATHPSLFTMLLIFPNLSCYRALPFYHATHPSLFTMLFISPSLSCYSYFPINHVTHLSQFITLLVFPHLSCYLFFQLIILLVLPYSTIHSTSHSTWYINDVEPKTPLKLSKKFLKTDKPTIKHTGANMFRLRSSHQ